MLGCNCIPNQKKILVRLLCYHNEFKLGLIVMKNMYKNYTLYNGYNKNQYGTD